MHEFRSRNLCLNNHCRVALSSESGKPGLVAALCPQLIGVKFSSQKSLTRVDEFRPKLGTAACLLVRILRTGSAAKKAPGFRNEYAARPPAVQRPMNPEPPRLFRCPSTTNLNRAERGIHGRLIVTQVYNLIATRK